MPGSHYFDEDPGARSRPTQVEVTLPDLSLSLRSDRGVFSNRRVDPGTLHLLREAPHPPPTGRLLDLGCGYGVIAAVLARRAPAATVWAVDVNRRALELVAANAADHGLTNVSVSTPADVPSGTTFDRIYSNPPIRIGKPALHALLLRWLPSLTPDGRAHLVVHKDKGADSLARWLSDQGFPATRLASRAGYRILDVTRAL